MSRKKKRKICYICNPIYLDLFCPNDPGHKITWSEYEQHIWCYDCEKDIKYEPGGTIVPWELSKMMGIDFRKYNIKTGEIIEYDWD